MSQSQLRIYRIEPDLLDEFVAAWSAGVRPLRRRFGFESAGWTVPAEDTFIWLVTYRGEGSFEDADTAYYASPERQAMLPDPAQWIIRNETRWLSPLSAGEPAPGRGGSAPSNPTPPTDTPPTPADPRKSPFRPPDPNA